MDLLIKFTPKIAWYRQSQIRNKFPVDPALDFHYLCFTKIALSRHIQTENGFPVGSALDFHYLFPSFNGNIAGYVPVKRQ